MKELLRQLPSVDELLKEDRVKAWLGMHPRVLVLDALRTALDRKRKAVIDRSRIQQLYRALPCSTRMGPRESLRVFILGKRWYSIRSLQRFTTSF